MVDIYQQKGFKDRRDYLADLADQYGVDYDTVATLAHVLGPNEDFDGLVSTLNDFPVDDVPDTEGAVFLTHKVPADFTASSGGEPVTFGERLMPGCTCGAAARGDFERCRCD